MQLSVIRTELWNILGQPTHIPDSSGGRLDRWINFAYQEIFGAIRFYEFETTVSTTTTASTRTVSIPTTVRSLLNLRVIRKQVTETPASETSFTLPGVPVVASTVTVYDGTTVAGTDDGAGAISGARITSGTINYTTGAVTLVWSGSYPTGTDTVTYTYREIAKLDKSHYQELDDKEDTGTNQPSKYARFGSLIILDPTPDAVYTIEIRGRNPLTELSADSDEPSTPREWDEIILKGAEERGLYALGRKEESRESFNKKIQLIRSRVKDEDLEIIDHNFGLKLKVRT